MFGSSKKAILLLAGIILLLSSALIGCSKQENASSIAEKPSPTEKSVTLSWLRDIGSMNPHTYNPSQLFAQSMIYEPVVR